MMEQAMDSQIDGGLYEMEIYYNKIMNMTYSELEIELFRLESNRQDCIENHISTFFDDRNIKLIKNSNTYKNYIRMMKIKKFVK